MVPNPLSTLGMFIPIAGISMNVIAVAGIMGAVILGVVWMAIQGSGGGSD